MHFTLHWKKQEGGREKEEEGDSACLPRLHTHTCLSTHGTCAWCTWEEDQNFALGPTCLPALHASEQHTMLAWEPSSWVDRFPVCYICGGLPTLPPTTPPCPSPPPTAGSCFQACIHRHASCAACYNLPATTDLLPFQTCLPLLVVWRQAQASIIQTQKLFERKRGWDSTGDSHWLLACCHHLPLK